MRNTQDTANSGIPRGLEKMWHGLRHQSKRCLQKNKSSFEPVNLIPGQERQSAGGPVQWGHCLVGPVLRHQLSEVLRVPESGQDPYWDPGSEERMPDFRAFGGGGGGALASLRTGNGGAISVEFLWLLSWGLLLGGGGGGTGAVISPSVCKEGELRVLVALGVSGGGLKGVD